MFPHFPLSLPAPFSPSRLYSWCSPHWSFFRKRSSAYPVSSFLVYFGMMRNWSDILAFSQTGINSLWKHTPHLIYHNFHDIAFSFTCLFGQIWGGFFLCSHHGLPQYHQSAEVISHSLTFFSSGGLFLQYSGKHSRSGCFAGLPGFIKIQLVSLFLYSPGLFIIHFMPFCTQYSQACLTQKRLSQSTIKIKFNLRTLLTYRLHLQYHRIIYICSMWHFHHPLGGFDITSP